MKRLNFGKLRRLQKFNFALNLEQQCLLCNSVKTTSIACPELSQSDFCLDCTQQFQRNLISCKRCAIPLENTYQSDLICGVCQLRPPSFNSTIASFRYEYPINKLITAFKYKQRLELLPALAKEMLNDVKTFYDFSENRPDALIPIPLHRFREFKRGYNQASLLAKSLAKELNIPLLENLLQRHKHTSIQASLNKKQRQKNLRKAFSFKQTASTPLKYIILIDDVMTTGSTVEAASQACRQASIERIDIWCCARAEI